jgi:hypothetical protein
VKDPAGHHARRRWGVAVAAIIMEEEDVGVVVIPVAHWPVVVDVSPVVKKVRERLTTVACIRV